MAAPVVIIKTAHTVHKVVKNWVPGGWKTVGYVGIGFLILAVLIPSILMKAIFSFVPEVNNIKAICATNESSGDDDHHGNENGEGSGGANVNTGYGKHKAPNVNFPSESSETIVKPVKGVGSSSYGPRKRINIGGMLTNGFHDGADFGAPMGTPIVAMSDGIVSMSKNATGTLEGSMVEIQHNINGKKYTTAYRHVQGKSIQVKVNDKVKAGQQIAKVGSEGMSTGPHLHFVVAQGSYHRYNSANGPAGTLNPLAFLKSNGAVDASGGLEGNDFNGVDNNDPGSVECPNEGEGSSKLPGDGTTEWNGFKNGEFSDEDLVTVENIKLYKDGGNQLKSLLEAYKKDNGGQTLTLKEGYVSRKEQEKRYKENKQIEKPGQSIYGYARIVQFGFKNDFNSKEYKWLKKNAGKYGFEQPERYASNSTNKDARIWSYNGTNEFDYPASNGSAKANQELARKIMKNEYPEFDSDREFSCLVNMWHKESSWNHKAANGASSARGIPQAMMSIHFGKDWQTNAKGRNYLDNPDVQIRWGLNYIKGNPKYRTPCGAWAVWQTQQWY